MSTTMLWTTIGVFWSAINCALAVERGRSGLTWFLVGLVCPPIITTPVLLYLPLKREAIPATRRRWQVFGGALACGALIELAIAAAGVWLGVGVV